ncbi:MAG: hypothetical protein ABIO63_02435 [Casimicrobiaceae bacterium]
MSAPGRPKREYRSAQREGESLMSAQREGEQHIANFRMAAW